MTQTPLQEAIQKLETLKEEVNVQHIPHDQKVWKRMGVDAAIDRLKSLLPKEKEFIIEVFKSGWRTRNEGKNYTLASDLAEYLSKYNQQ